MVETDCFVTRPTGTFAGNTSRPPFPRRLDGYVAVGKR